MNAEKKSMVFLDAGNLLGGWWTYCKQKNFTRFNTKTNKMELTTKIDYEKLIKELTKETDFIRGYFYDSIDEPLDTKKQYFFDFLRRLGITIVTKRLRFKIVECKHCKEKDERVPYQKGVDVALVTELMSLAHEDAYEIAILITGDNDFVDAINHIKSKGLKVWVASFMNCLGEDTRRAADKCILLDDLFDNISKD